MSLCTVNNPWKWSNTLLNLTNIVSTPRFWQELQYLIMTFIMLCCSCCLFFFQHYKNTLSCPSIINWRESLGDLSEHYFCSAISAIESLHLLWWLHRYLSADRDATMSILDISLLTGFVVDENDLKAVWITISLFTYAFDKIKIWIFFCSIFT